MKHTGVLIFARCRGGNTPPQGGSALCKVQSPLFSRVVKASRRFRDCFVSKLSILENTSGRTTCQEKELTVAFLQTGSSRLQVAWWWGGNKSFGTGESRLWIPTATREPVTLGSHSTSLNLSCIVY